MLPLRQNVDLCDPRGRRYSSVDGSLTTPTVQNKKRKLSSDVKNGSRAVASHQSDIFYPHFKRQRSEFNTDKEQEGITFLMAEQEKRAFSKYGNHYHELSPMALTNSSTKPGQAKKIVIKNFKGN